MKESNFKDMQALASDEAEAICKLEKRNFELVELLKILVNELHREIEGKDDQIKEIGTQLAEAKDDIVKLEEANGMLKGQAISKWVDAAEADFDSMFQEEFALLRNSREISRSRHSEMSRYSEISRQSSERQTAASTPFPQDDLNQESGKDEKLGCASGSTPTPSRLEGNLQVRMKTALPKL